MGASKPEETLAYHLKIARIKHSREVVCIPGRKFRFDFLVEPDLLIEVNGGLHLSHFGGHSSKKGILRDMEKSNLAVLHGYRLLSFDPGAIYSGSALQMIQRCLYNET